ncbi:ATPase domain-containing protein [Halomonas saccharevitans]|uniref:ATPase domain-containing protein n=1 Tax=Halomonas saccharevitans TaxID=416872 RepID=UPI001C31DD92|nr:ATPase domain-containing protein [Halomonas saccharevitans]
MPPRRSCPPASRYWTVCWAGGIYRGATAMYSGVSGTGKTTFAAAFARAACERGDNVLYLSFEEGAEELARNQQSVGIDMRAYADPPSRKGRLAHRLGDVVDGTPLLPELPGPPGKRLDVRHGDWPPC